MSDPAPDSSKRRKTGIDSKWKAYFPWLQLVEDDQGMLCKLCHKHGRCPQKSIIGCAVWVDLPCKPVVRQSLPLQKCCLYAAHIFITFLHVLNIHAAYVLHTRHIHFACVLHTE